MSAQKDDSLVTGKATYETARFIVTPIESHLEVSFAHWISLPRNACLYAILPNNAVVEGEFDEMRPNTIGVDNYCANVFRVWLRQETGAAHSGCKLVCQLGCDGEDLPLEIEEAMGPQKRTGHATLIKSLNREELRALMSKASSNEIIHFIFTANEVVPKGGEESLLKPTPKNFAVLFDGKPFAKSAETDFSITSGEDEFHCHQLVLCKRSPVFERMINGSGAEASTGSADLSEYGSENTKLLLEVIYGTSKIDEITKMQQMLDLYKLLHLYGVEPELNYWAKFLALKLPIDASNVATVANFATVYGMAELKKKCAEALCKMPRSTLRSEEWKQLNESDSEKAVEFYRELFETMMLQDK